MDRFLNGKTTAGTLALDALSQNLPPRLIRRLKRLPRMALALTDALKTSADTAPTPSSIFWGTGWGALSETHDFLTKLFESNEKFSSPTDFIGSVHNAPAGQMAMHLKATGTNITTTGGDYSFEQALLSAELLVPDNPDETALVIGADEHHTPLSGLFDASVATAPIPSDGGGALLVKRAEGSGEGTVISLRFYENAGGNPNIIGNLIDCLGGPAAVNPAYGALLIGIPAAHRKTGQAQLVEFQSRTGYANPVIDYRKYTGEHASASAVASVLGACLIQLGQIPARLTGQGDMDLAGRRILIMGTGPFVTAIELYRP
jgi:3-oxoacyl-[acyl-carrier-protein] synthase-1/3-oxoacyl-[acyl-carrier-protein] synthase II